MLATSYYPEHWPKSRWNKDAELMEKAGITKVRMGEFAWCRFEPKDGEFDFDWLEEAIEMFGRYNIKTILGTPTAAYPAWLHRKYPDIHQIKSNGQIREYGARQDACRNNPNYRKHALKIVKTMLEKFGNNSNIVAWQTDNEFGGHQSTLCYCNHCEKEFRNWLRDKFSGNISGLNDALGTIFWSQEYNSFDDISIPRDPSDQPQLRGGNPSLLLDFRRFCSDTMIEFNRNQIELIRKLSPDRTITHNLVGIAWNDIDYFKLAKDLDIISWDNYPFINMGREDIPDIVPHNLMRGLKSKNTWIMEQASGPGGWEKFAATPEPGRMRLWAYQSIARGADLVSFFRWRTCCFGTEQYWHGILYHHGLPQRRYEELKKIGKEVQVLKEHLKDRQYDNNIALLFDYDSLWALEIQPHIGDDITYPSLFEDYLQILTSLGLNADIVTNNHVLSKYKIVIAPCLHVCDKELANSLKSYVSNGGTLVLGCRSGVKDENNLIVNELLPGDLRPIAGCHVEEYDAFSKTNESMLNIESSKGESFEAKGIAEILKPTEEAEVLFRYQGRYYTNEPAVVENKLGKGKTIYIGTILSRDAIRNLFLANLDLGLLPDYSKHPKGIEYIKINSKKGNIGVYLNHNLNDIEINLPNGTFNLFDNKPLAESVIIPALDVLIVSE